MRDAAVRRVLPVEAASEEEALFAATAALPCQTRPAGGPSPHKSPRRCTP